MPLKRNRLLVAFFIFYKLFAFYIILFELSVICVTIKLVIIHKKPKNL